MRASTQSSRCSCRSCCRTASPVRPSSSASCAMVPGPRCFSVVRIARRLSGSCSTVKMGTLAPRPQAARRAKNFATPILPYSGKTFRFALRQVPLSLDFVVVHEPDPAVVDVIRLLAAQADERESEVICRGCNKIELSRATSRTIVYGVPRSFLHSEQRPRLGAELFLGRCGFAQRLENRLAELASRRRQMIRDGGLANCLLYT